MKEHNQSDRIMTRRNFLGYSAALAALSLAPRVVFAQAADKSDSRFNGVQIEKFWGQEVLGTQYLNLNYV